MRGAEFAELKAFVAVVDRQSFVRAAESLRMAPSSLSQTIRSLETRLGVPLLVRTTRSVAPTEAGVRLYTRFRAAMLEMDAAVSDALERRDEVAGTVRLHAPRLAVQTFIEPILGEFNACHPDVVLDISVNEVSLDIVKEGLDVGMRLGESVDRDMLAVRLGKPFRTLAVASPEYVRRHGAPKSPADLRNHRCINWRQPGTEGLYKWEFFKGGQWFSVAVEGPLITSHKDLALAAALQGVGIAFWADYRVQPFLEQGSLVALLERWCALHPGWFLYYPRQRCSAPAVKAFVTFLRKAWSPTDGRGKLPRTP
ncbi:LysR family transcriptional regulator [Pendulispora brunnea]|uniref:LysR family transcriptional regulator n=1 Tax=Pendulispora brunnea TaxID=2905690 RepID=A0ABZ2K6M2_9BACT